MIGEHLILRKGNPYISQIRHEFQIGDRVRIKQGLFGVTAIDRGKVYTIEQFYDKSPCTIFSLEWDDTYVMSFIDKEGYYAPKYFDLVERNIGRLPEDLFTI